VEVGRGRVGAEARGWKDGTDGAGMANGAEESGCAGGREWNGPAAPAGPSNAARPCQRAH
jgi:hypothetical protein